MTHSAKVKTENFTHKLNAKKCDSHRLFYAKEQGFILKQNFHITVG